MHVAITTAHQDLEAELERLYQDNDSRAFLSRVCQVWMKIRRAHNDVLPDPFLQPPKVEIKK